MRTSAPFRRASLSAATILLYAGLASTCLGAVHTSPTMDPGLLAAALNPTGLSITSVWFRAGVPGQFGTYSNFEIPPVTIRPGIVLSSGHVGELGPIPGTTDPAYDPASPPAQVNTQMVPDPDAGTTPEFDAFGAVAGHIENFSGSYDAAAMVVEFDLPQESQIQFDFVFGSVEFPVWTSSYTDSFLVFLDGYTPADQITYDAAGNAVQVGSSFSNLETTADNNTAFSNPHAVIHHLTTTSATLSAGHHFIVFEVADVNDHILDSAAFIANLRAGSGTEGTDPTEDTPHAGCPHITTHPSAASACPSATITFSAAATGAPVLDYRWQWNETGTTIWKNMIDGVNLDQFGSPAFTVNGAEALDVSVAAAPAGSLIPLHSVRLVVANDCGDDRSDPALLHLCAGDLSCDGFVDDTDFVLFAAAYNALLCSDPAMGPVCTADFNRDGFVDDSDFVLFAAAYNELLCP